MEYILKTEALTKQYNKRNAIRGYSDGRAGKHLIVKMLIEQIKHFLGFLNDFGYL